MAWVLVRREVVRDRTAAWWSALAGMSVGAGLASLLDRRRRIVLMERAGHLARELSEAGGILGEDLRNRAHGLLAETAGLVRSEHAGDDVLFARVRSGLGRVCSHPGAVEVVVRGGEVTLTGAILETEAKRVLSAARRVRGVGRVVDGLQRHPSAAHVPALQGGAPQRLEPELTRRFWSPSARLASGLAGLGLGAWGFKGGLLGLGAGLAGGLLFLRAATNLETRRLVGIGAGRRAIDIDKAIYIDAPREEVFAFFQAFENFPRFMSHLREVRTLSPERSHWVADGPVGMAIEWDAEITRLIPNEQLAWRSIGTPGVANAGMVRFQSEGPGTRLMLRLSYNPPAGAIGHAFARLLGADPKKMLDDDLLRLKSLLEKGKARGREGPVTKEEMRPTTPTPDYVH